MMDRLNENAIVKRVQDGDIESFSLIFEKYGTRLFNVIYRLVNDYDEAHDVTQEAFVKAYTSIRSFNFHSQFFTWLYRIGVNSARDHLRRRKTHAEWIQRVAESEKTEQVDGGELKRRIDRMLNTLTPEHREVIILRAVEGFSYVEISQILGCSIGTVRSRLGRAREQLRRIYGSTARIMKESK